MTITHLRNPQSGLSEVSILPEEGDTKVQLLARAKEFGGTIQVYEDIFLNVRTLNEVVVTLNMTYRQRPSQ